MTHATLPCDTVKELIERTITRISEIRVALRAQAIDVNRRPARRTGYLWWIKYHPEETDQDVVDRLRLDGDGIYDGIYGLTCCPGSWNSEEVSWLRGLRNLACDASATAGITITLDDSNRLLRPGAAFRNEAGLQDYLKPKPAIKKAIDARETVSRFLAMTFDERVVAVRDLRSTCPEFYELVRLALCEVQAEGKS